MAQSKTNETEWRNPANWSGPKLLSVYFSKQDSRVWVPKQIPWTGWTVNLGRAAGAAWLIAIIIAVAIAPILYMLIADYSAAQ